MADERSEPFEQLEERVNRRVKEALSGLQQEIRDRLKRAGDQLVGELDRELGDVTSGLPSSFLPREELEPLAAEAQDAGRRQLLGHLLAAFSALDAAASQRAVLDTLIDECGRFADRTAVLLTRDDGYRLWGAAGWGSDIPSDVSLPWDETGPWSRETAGSGASALSGNDCAPLCSRLDGAVPQGGVLVPLILRDRLAAVVYADHDGGAFFTEAVQALTWAAALALEALPFRQRADTPTLRFAGAGGEAVPVLAAAEPGSEPESQPEPEFESEEETAVARDEEDSLEDSFEVESGEEVEPVELLDAADEGWELEADEPSSSDFGELEIAEAADEGLPEPPTWETPTLDAGRDDDDGADELVLADDFDGDLYAGEEGSGEEEGEEEEVELIEEPGEETVDQPPAAAAPASEEVESGQVPRIAGFEPAASAPAAPEPPADDRPPGLETAATPSAASGDDSPQVAPPSDHSGPGLAFGGADAEADAGDGGARHEEARRLARLLVSEIRLYNEDLVEEGRRNQDVYQRLKEDIDRSRQIYEERIDAGLREDTDYFYEELVRNLGGGDASALGI